MKQNENSERKSTPLLSPYVSNILARSKEVEQKRLPLHFSGNAGVLFLDISGFTTISKKLNDSGFYGIEIITKILNRYLDEVVQEILKFEGYILKFGGDSLLIVFPGNYHDSFQNMKNCTNNINHIVATLNIDFQKKYDITLKYHGSFSWGEVHTIITGNFSHHLDYLSYGKPLRKVFALDEKRRTEKIVIDQQDISQIETSDFKLLESDQNWENLFLPSVVQKKLQEEKFSAELRNAAILFLNLENINPQEPISDQDFHDYYLEVQKIVYQLEGTVNKIDFNDKGYMILIVFGIPQTHFDDIERAIVCSNRIVQIHNDNIRIKIGLNYSRIYAGILGARKRYEYGIIGNAVNIAARLMSFAEYGQTIISQEIKERLASNLRIEFVDKVAIRGLTENINVYKLLEASSDYWDFYQQKFAQKKFICHQEELQKLKSYLKSAGIIMISGKRGVGKSFLVFQALQNKRNSAQKINVFLANEFESVQPLAFIKNIIKQKLQILDIKSEFAELEAYCKKNELKVEINFLKEYFFAETSLNEIWDINEKKDLLMENITELLIPLFSESQFLVFDNLHWLDELSSEICARVIHQLKIKKKNIILISDQSKISDTCSEMIDKKIELQNLSKKEIKSFIFAKFQNISRDTIPLFENITQGNPFILDEYARLIKKTSESEDLLTQSKLKTILAEELNLAQTEDLFLSQFEKLPADAKYLLKIASIAGITFSIDALMNVQNNFSAKEIFTILGNLIQHNVINKRDLQPMIKYSFENDIYRDSIYKTILLSEKRKLHNKIGNYLEQENEKELSEFYEILAFQYTRAENRKKSLEYNLKAAEKNYRLYSFSESYRYYLQASQITENETQKYEILLRMVELALWQGELKLAEQNISELEKTEIPTSEIKDKYYFLKIKLFSIKADHEKVYDYYSQISTRISTKFYQELNRIFFIDSLRALSKNKEFIEASQKLLEKLQKQEEHFLICKLSGSIGAFYSNISEYKNALEYYQLTRKSAEKIADKLSLRLALTSIGSMYSRLGDQDRSLEYLQKAKKIAENTGDKNGYAKIILDIAVIYRIKGFNDKALQLFQQSLHLSKLVGNLQQLETAIYNIGEVYYYKNDHDRAMKQFEEALKIARKISDKNGMSFIYDAMGDINHRKGELTKAKGIYRKNLEMQKTINDQEGIAHSLGNLGNIAKAENKFSQAIDFYNQQIKICNKIGDKSGEGRAYFNWGSVFLDLNEKENAKKKFQQALQLFSECQAKQFMEIAKEQIRNLEEK